MINDVFSHSQQSKLMMCHASSRVKCSLRQDISCRGSSAVQMSAAMIILMFLLTYGLDTYVSSDASNNALVLL